MEITLFMWAVYIMAGSIFCYVVVKVLQQISPADTHARRQLEAIEKGNSYTRRMKDSVDKNDWEGAIRWSSLAIEAYKPFEAGQPVIESLYPVMADAHLRLQNFSQAIHFAKKKITIGTLWAKATSHYFQGEYTDAIDACITMVVNVDRHSQILWLRGLCRLKVGDRTMAMDDFKKAAEMDRKYHEDYDDLPFTAYFKGLGLAYLKEKREALEYLKLAHDNAKKEDLKWLQDKATNAARKLNSKKKTAKADGI